MTGRSAQGAAEEAPGPTLAVTLGLIALLFLPLAGGGYSGAGYQVGFVLLPLAAAIAWATAVRRPVLAVVVLLLFTAAGLALPMWVHEGRLLWYYLLHLPASWVVVWVLLTRVPGRHRHLFPALVLGAVLTALYGWFLWLGAGRLDYHITGTFGLHNAYAGFLLLAWPAAALAALVEERSLYRWLYVLAAIWLAAALALTYSRAAWVVFGLQLIGLALYWVWWRYRAGQREGRPLAYVGIGLAALLLLLLTLPSVRNVLSLIADFGGYSMQGRLRFWQAALEIFHDHWLLGVGPGNFAYVYPQYQLDWMFYSVDPHCWPLQLLCELGLPGLLILTAVLVGIVWWARRLWLGTGGSPVAAVLIAAVFGSLLHAAVDFDYTFGATTALLGALLAYGAYRAGGSEAESGGFLSRWLKLAVVAAVVLLVGSALVGEAFTLERYQLDRLRDVPGLTLEQQTGLLRQALNYDPYNHRTHYQLATVLSQSMREGDRVDALAHLETCLGLNPRYAKAWALKGLLARPPAAGQADLERALELDPYNFPEHYFYYASLAEDDETRRSRLLLGVERIPAHHPITPQHVRPSWYELNPMWAEWWYELARLSEDEEEKEQFRSIGARFAAYWEGELKSRESLPDG